MSSSRSSRGTSGSRTGSSAFSPGTPSSSRQFLSMLNPMSRTHQGYIRADATVLEEDDESENQEGNSDGGSRSGRSTPLTPRQRQQPSTKAHGKRRANWDGNASELNVLRPNTPKDNKPHAAHSTDDEDDEVPQSFMIEATAGAARHPKPRGRQSDSQLGTRPTTNRARPLNSTNARSVPPLLPTVAPHVSIPPKPSELDVHQGTKAPRVTHAASTSGSSNNGGRQPKGVKGLDGYQKALWTWTNAVNLDAFLQEVYRYYVGKGLYSIALSKGLNLLTVGFVIGFSTFLLGCIDYSQFRRKQVERLDEVLIEHCISKFSAVSMLFFLLFATFYVVQIFTYIMEVIRLFDLYNFYTYLLNIPDSDIQTISWSEVVRRIAAIREQNPITAISSNHSYIKDNNTSTAKLDAHDIANRILRQENYLIALFNKELLDLRVPLPGILNRFVTPETGKGKILTQSLEWNLRFCLMNFLFDSEGQVKRHFLKSKYRQTLVKQLQYRFIFTGILNAVFSPFIVLYVMMYSFFRYFEQYHKEPSAIGGRRYTLYAQWKFREFNELQHIFTRRLDESHPIASMYIGQFPNAKVAIIMRFLAFIAGSFAAVLALVTICLNNFQITPHGTALFWLGIFGAFLTVARGMVPAENHVFDPELLMTEVITYTHYMPDDWKGELHSLRVNQEFAKLFQNKVVIFVWEIISIVTTPFVLWFSLPACAPAIIDFFREFTVHVDGRGYVCSFAEFNFERHGNVKFGAPATAQDKRMISNDGKMEKSFLHFKAANPDWNPTDPTGSLYLNRMAEATANIHHQITRRRQREAALNDEIDLSATVHFAPDPRAQIYEAALRQSQHAALTRRKGFGMGNSFMTMSMLNAGGPEMSMYAGGASMARSAVLGDSQGSVQLGGPSNEAAGAVPEQSPPKKAKKLEPVENEIGLGDSYDDGMTPAGNERPEDEDEELEDGGVLGLLAQIYGRRDGPRVGIS